MKVKRKGVDVRARKGYRAYTEDEVKRAEAPEKAGPPPDIEAALGSIPTPARGHAIRTWTGFDRGADGKTDVTLVWEALPADVGDSGDRTMSTSSPDPPPATSTFAAPSTRPRARSRRPGG